MRWPWVRKQPEVKPANGSAAVTAAELGSRCQECGEHALMRKGERVLCWAHYLAHMRTVGA